MPAQINWVYCTTVGKLIISDSPEFDPLRGHPRFQALLQRMKLPG